MYPNMYLKRVVFFQHDVIRVYKWSGVFGIRFFFHFLFILYLMLFPTLFVGNRFLIIICTFSVKQNMPQNLQICVLLARQYLFLFQLRSI